MERTALYRKYRSADFNEVLGQTHITRALEGAIARDMISHAYLFAGPRGVGKTSMARILARRVNDLPATEDISSHLDILEIDGASNNGVEEIRALRERISSAPTALKYKIYIIDEVHMLSRGAFNALLKTLEEPPPHVIFIFATTEAHKVPDTIISRTQRFDLRSITEADIITHLKKIAKAEKIDVNDEALAAIAKNAQGGFRDAIGLLDQLATTGESIDASAVSELLGLAPESAIEALIGAIKEPNLEAAAKLLEDLVAQGNDPQLLCSQIILQLRDQLRGAFAQKTADSSMAAATNLALINEFNVAMRDFKATSQYSLPLELAVYRACLINTGVQAPSKAQPTTTSIKSAKTSAPSGDDATNYTKALSYIKTKNNSLYAVMNMADYEIDGDKLIMNFNFSFHKDRIEEPKNRQIIETIMSRAFGRELSLVCELNNSKRVSVDPDEELVSTALEILGGEVVDG